MGTDRLSRQRATHQARMARVSRALEASLQRVERAKLLQQQSDEIIREIVERYDESGHLRDAARKIR